MAKETSRREFGGAAVLERIGTALVRADLAILDRGDDDEMLLTITVQTPWKRGADYLVVGRMLTGGRHIVAFHGADTLYEALRGFSERFVNKQLVWKDDEYA